MRIAVFFLTFFSLHVSLTSCGQGTRDQAKPADTKTSKIDCSSVAIIPFDQQGNWPFDNSYKPTNLTDYEIFQVDSLLVDCALNYNKTLSEDLKESYSIDFKKYLYKRQYVAVINNKGEKEVWVNGLCSTWNSRWKKELLLVNDGGNCNFNLKINLTTKKCFEVVVNGYA
jgi:hypothetical protein